MAALRKVYSTLMSAASANARFAEQKNETLAFARRQHVHRNLRELQTNTRTVFAHSHSELRVPQGSFELSPTSELPFPTSKPAPSDAFRFIWTMRRASRVRSGLCAMLDCGILNLARSIIEPGSNSLPQVRVGLGEVPKDMLGHGLNRQVFS